MDESLSTTPGTVSVTLPSQQWTILIQMIAEQPYRLSAPLIHEIQRQWSAQNDRS